MITTLFAGVLGVLYFFISIDVIKNRKKYQVSLGYGPNNEIAEIVSAHSNFSSYAPLLLILTYLLETSPWIPIWATFVLALGFTLGRVLHYLAFKGKKMNFKLRVKAMMLTLFPLLILGILNILDFLLSFSQSQL